MKDELKFMEQNKVWNLVKIPKSCKRVGYEWILKTKQDSNDNVERYKFRLVVKCFTQENDIDYKKIFSLVSKKDSLKIIMVLVTHYNLELHLNECEKYLFKWEYFFKKSSYGWT